MPQSKEGVKRKPVSREDLEQVVKLVLDNEWSSKTNELFQDNFDASVENL